MSRRGNLLSDDFARRTAAAVRSVENQPADRRPPEADRGPLPFPLMLYEIATAPVLDEATKTYKCTAYPVRMYWCTVDENGHWYAPAEEGATGAVERWRRDESETPVTLFIPTNHTDDNQVADLPPSWCRVGRRVFTSTKQEHRVILSAEPDALIPVMLKESIMPYATADAWPVDAAGAIINEELIIDLVDESGVFCGIGKDDQVVGWPGDYGIARQRSDGKFVIVELYQQPKTGVLQKHFIPGIHPDTIDGNVSLGLGPVLPGFGQSIGHFIAAHLNNIDPISPVIDLPNFSVFDSGQAQGIGRIGDVVAVSLKDRCAVNGDFQTCVFGKPTAATGKGDVARVSLWWRDFATDELIDSGYDLYALNEIGDIAAGELCALVYSPQGGNVALPASSIGDPPVEVAPDCRWAIVASASALKWAKIQSSPTNGSGDQRREFSAKNCDADGNNETGDAFSVFSPLKPHAYTELLEGDVVGYITDAVGDHIIVTDCWQSGWRCLATLGADITPQSTSIPVTFLGLVVGPQPVLQYAENPLHFTAPSGSVVELAFRSTVPEWFISSVADNGEAIDVKVKITDDDAEAGFLDDKLVTTDPWIGKDVQTDQQTGVQQLLLEHTGPGEVYATFDPTPPELTLVETTLTHSRPFPQFDEKGHKAGDNNETAASTILVKGDGVWIGVENDEGDLRIYHDGPGEPTSATSAFSLSILNNRLTLNAHVVLSDACGHVAGEDDYSTYVDLPVPIEGEVVIEGHDPWIIVSENEGVITIHHGGPGSASGDPYNGVESVSVSTDPETGDVYLDVGSHQLTHDEFGHKVAISAEYLVQLLLVKVENVVGFKLEGGYLKYTTEEQWVLKKGQRTDHNWLQIENCPE